MSSVSSPDDTSPRPSPIRMWHWPVFQTGWKGVFFMLVLIGVFLLIQQRTAQTGMASLSVLAILSVTHWFWLPVRYKFNSYGIERRFFGVPQRFPWARIEAFRPLKDGILLSRSTATSDSLHTMFIAWSNRRHELESMVTYFTRQVSRKHGSSNSIRS